MIPGAQRPVPVSQQHRPDLTLNTSQQILNLHCQLPGQGVAARHHSCPSQGVAPRRAYEPAISIDTLAISTILTRQNYVSSR